MLLFYMHMTDITVYQLYVCGHNTEVCMYMWYYTHLLFSTPLLASYAVVAEGSN